MENKANYALVGALATVVLAALFGFVFWFAGPSSSLPVKDYDVVFTGTVSGIGPGTDVLFNGIKIGQVKTVALDPEDTDRVIARIELDASVPVKSDTKVLMGFQGLTGVGSLQLSGGSKTASAPPVEAGRSVPTLYAKVSDFQSILDGLSSTINGTSTAVDRLNGFLDANDAKLNDTITNVATFSEALAANSAGVKDALATISDAGKKIGPMAEQIGTLTTDLNALVAAVPPEKVTAVVDNVTSFSDTLAANSDNLDTFFQSTATLSKNLTDITDGLGASVDKINAVTAEIDPDAIGRVITNVDEFSGQLGSLTSDLKSMMAAAPPEKIAALVDDVGVFTQSLSRNSSQIDGLFTSATSSMKVVSDAVAGLAPAVDKINQVAANIDPVSISRVLSNVDAFASKLGGSGDEFDTIVANINSVSSSLLGSAGKVDAILDKVDQSVTGAEGQGVFAQIGEAAQSVKELADQLKVSTAQIAVGLNDFTSGGLSSYSALAVNAQETLQRLDRVVRNLESNPQGLIFGGDTVRDYNKK